MILTKDEAICLVLALSDKNTVSSPTKLNKLLARLNLYFIPIDFRFNLNKYGSFSAELNFLMSNKYYTIEPYEYKDRQSQKYILNKEGMVLFETKVLKKISKIMKQDEFDGLKQELNSLSQLKSEEISANEHKKLLVDVDDRFKLKQKLNEVFIELKDIYTEIDKIGDDSLTAIKLKSLIEYSYYLIKYLREKRFKNIYEKSYDYDAYMFDYYFLHNIGKVIPIIKKQITEKNKDEILINKYYQYMINSIREDYPFSLDNPNLKDLIAA